MTPDAPAFEPVPVNPQSVRDWNDLLLQFPRVLSRGMGRQGEDPGIGSSHDRPEANP